MWVRRRLTSIVCALISFLVAEESRAGEGSPPDEPPPIDRLEPLPETRASAWTAQPLALEAHASLGGPLGALGLAAEYSPSHSLSWSLGWGLAKDGKSPQAATSLRFRLISGDRTAMGAEGGLGVGRYEDRFDCASAGCPPDWRWDPAAWGHIGLMLEARTGAGVELRWGFGARAIMNVVDGECRRCDASDEPNMLVTTVPYVYFAVGQAFEL